MRANAITNGGRGDGWEYWQSPQPRIAPQDFADPEWQKNVTDEEIRKYFDEKVIAAAEKQLGVAGMRDRITQAITSQRADQEMDTWLRPR